MKVLLVAESEEAITTLTSFFKKQSYDVITYRWLLKALDNLEEIAPQVIVISAVDYPRHWKTLIQYIHGAVDAANQPATFLLTDNTFAENEKQKASCLGVRRIIKGLNQEDLEQVLDFLPIIPPIITQILPVTEQPVKLVENEPKPTKLQEPIKVEPPKDEPTKLQEPPKVEWQPIPNEVSLVNVNPDKPIQTEITAEECFFTKDIKTTPSDKLNTIKDVSFMFCNPKTGGIVTGKCVKCDMPILNFIPDSQDSIRGIRLGQVIDNCTLKNLNGISSVKVQIQSTILPEMQICILKKNV